MRLSSQVGKGTRLQVVLSAGQPTRGEEPTAEGLDRTEGIDARRSWPLESQERASDAHLARR